MQQIERYGVIALVFLLVTIVAVSFWGDSKSPGFWSRLTGKTDAKKEQPEKTAPVADLKNVTDPTLPLTATPSPSPAPNVVVDLGAPNATPTASDAMGRGAGTIPTHPPEGSVVVQTTPGTTPPAPGMPVPQGPANAGQPIKPEPTAPAASSDYVVQKGDSLARIAATKLGSENRWKEILALNPGLEPRNLSAGKTIRLPGASATSVAKAPAKKEAAADKKVASVPSRTEARTETKTESKTDAKKSTKETAAKSSPAVYVVQKGDHMTTIAQKVLGDSHRWKEIVAANPGIDPNRIAVGDKLKLPGAKHEPLVASADPKPGHDSSVAKPEATSKPKNAEVAMAEKPHVR